MSGAEWSRVEPSGAEWSRVEPVEPMEPSGARVRIASEWSRVDADRVEPSAGAHSVEPSQWSREQPSTVLVQPRDGEESPERNWQLQTVYRGH